MMDAIMLEVITHPTPTLHTEIHSVPIPVPKDNEILIKVQAASSNPKDWDHPTSLNRSLNSGDDLAGTVHAVGTDVADFKIGDRVAAFHPMATPHGAYAQYSIAPAHTVVHIPENVTFEEASTIPLVSTTAALTLFRRLGFAPPWELKADYKPQGPLIIYGATSSLGTFAIKLAKLANIHPLIAIGGGSSDYAKALLDAGKGDAFVDYRNGVDAMKSDVEKALDGIPAHRAFDCISSKKTWIALSQILEISGGSKMSVVSGANAYDDPEIPRGVQVVYTYVGTAHDGKYPSNMPKQPHATDVDGDVKFAEQLFKWIGEMLAEGKYEGHPYEIVPGGLGGVADGLTRLKNNQAKGVKFVYQVD